jgi:two-component system, NtrC family, C4-dicarboxylate transport response regulator DctD
MPVMKLVFIVDHEPQARHGLWCMLTRPGWSFRLFADARAALAAMDVRPPDLVVADLDLPDHDGVALLGEMHRRDPSVRKILLIGTEPPPGARHALHDGIIDGVAAKPAGMLLGLMARELLDEPYDDDWMAQAG